MVDPKHNAIIRELVARGLIAAQPEPRRLPQGNVDRRSEGARTAWHAMRPDGTEVKLTIGADLADLAKRHGALAEACPGLVPPLLYFEQLTGGSVLAEPFFEGPTLETALTTSSQPLDTLLKALGRAESALAATELPSDEAARRAEWDTWSANLLALPVWSDTERSILRDQVLPGLYALISIMASTTRWSNGDFTAGNLLVNAQGDIRLIDFEFAARTHFFPEDAVRFFALSPTCRRVESALADVVTPPALPWHLYFWLRQYQLEVTQNEPAYVARYRTARLGAIRSLAERILECPLTGWSVEPIALSHQIEEFGWTPDQSLVLHFGGWVYNPGLMLETMAAYDDRHQIVSSSLVERADVAQHFSTPSAQAGFQLYVPLAKARPKMTLAAITTEGLSLPFHTLETSSIPGRTLQFENYASWAETHDLHPPESQTGTQVQKPRFSILLPVYDTPPDFLRACLQSVLNQHYPCWELVIVDDASQASHVAPILREFAARETRIKFHRHPENQGIARATNTALSASQGDFIVLLDHDDLLRPHALAELANRLEREPELDALYSDEDKISAEGRPRMPFLKPAFSPEFLLGVMYVGHVLCVRTSVARTVGGFNPEFDGVQDYEFFLRVSGLTRSIGHIPRMLYHWRQSPTSSALHGNVKGNMDARHLTAVRAHLARTGDMRQAFAHGGHRVRLGSAAGTPHPEVFAVTSLTLPGGIIHTPVPDGLAPLEALRWACAQSANEIVVLLTAPALDMSKDWTLELAALAARPDSGLVAPVLLARDRRVLASGWTAGPQGSAPLLRGFHADSDGYNGSLVCSREVAAVSPHCVAVKRSFAQQVLARLPANATWLDLLTAFKGAGKYQRVCASARLQLDLAQDTPLAMAGTVPSVDPFFNPHFDPVRADYSLADNYPPGGKPASALQFHLDQPASWERLPRCLMVRGWAFANQGQTVQAVRLQAGPLCFAGVTGLSRPDVKASLPAAPGESTGFEVRAVLPAGKVQISIEIRLPDDRWQTIFTCTSQVPRQWLPLWLGGGNWTELMLFQMPGHMAYPAREIRPEKYPAARAVAALPKFSIVTPSYNQARFLPETMRSVLGQTGVDCDYVVQDGGSTDGSKELIAHFMETGDGMREAGKHETVESASEFRSPVSGLRLPANARCAFAWVSEPDSGQADAIAKGFAKTSGGPDDIMAWINSDDFYLPGALVYVADYFARHPEVDVVFGHRILVDVNSQEIGRWFLPRHEDEVLRLNDFVPQETLFWRRRIWDKVGGIDPAFKFALDWDLLLRFQAARARIVRIPYFLACFRIHSAQKTSAQMHSVGHGEITRLRERTFGRPFPPQELEQNPRLLRYLRRSAFIEFLWRLGIRAP